MSGARFPRCRDDFEAVIRILSAEEGGRKAPCFNGIRWDFAYAEDAARTPGAVPGLFMISPDFFDQRGDSIATHRALPQGVDLQARMTVVVDESRARIHRARIRPGTKFHCHEGPHVVAVGWVTRLTGLMLARD